MLDAALNERMTRVGPGTPAGELLRRQWLPIAAEAELAREPVRRVRLLGEDLVLFRALDGSLGLIGERCPHRGASLGYGFPDGVGLRCPYHGWLFDAGGSCVEQPNQQPDSRRLRERSAVPAYFVQAVGGLVFAYLGPAPAPAFQLYDLFARNEDATSFRDIGFAVIPCNWLQIMENSFDPTHVEWLHGRYFNYHLKRQGEPPTVLGGHHTRIGFDLTDYGIIKRRLREGQTEDADDWRVGHPVVFPHILKVGGAGFSSFQIRVPIDDCHTLHVWYCWYDLNEDYAEDISAARALDDHYQVHLQDADGGFLMDTIDSQDAMVWVTQGPVTDRHDEHLSSSDQGIALFRNLLKAQLERLEADEPLMNVAEPGGLTKVIELPMEHKDLGIGGSTDNPLSTYLRTQSKFSHRVRAVIERIEERQSGSVAVGSATR